MIDLAKRCIAHGDRPKAVELAKSVYFEAHAARASLPLGSGERWDYTMAMARAQAALLSFRSYDLSA